MSRPSLCSALAIAELSTFLMMPAAFLGLKVSSSRASSTPLPRIWSATSLALRADVPAPLSIAVTSIPLSSIHSPARRATGLAVRSTSFSVAGVAAKSARQHEFTQLVAHHVLGYQYGHVLAAVVHGDRQAHHLGGNHRAARPGLDRPPVVVFRGDLDLLQQMKIDERPFFKRSWHGGTSILSSITWRSGATGQSCCSCAYWCASCSPW